mgnify:CR=1 FL=1
MMNYRKRIERLLEDLAGYEAEAILISQPKNRSYLSGFDGSAGYLLITAEDRVLATDFRYLEQAKRQSPDYRVFPISGLREEWIPELLHGHNIRFLAFESRNITFYHYRELSDIIKKSGLGIGLVPVDGIVEEIRKIKEPGEIELVTSAVAISDAAMEYARGLIASHITEQELGWEIERFIREAGSEPVPFGIIVGSGENAALPHCRAASRDISSGGPVLLDFGARVGGYSSDLSRTFIVGGGDETFKRVYDIVLGAQLAAIEMVKEGMTGEEADNIARTVITEAGYGEYFGHALGHGIGLLPHEAPRLGSGSKEKIREGMVFTIEPGIYIPGWGGVRIEDTVVMDGGRVRVISKAEKIGVDDVKCR